MAKTQEGGDERDAIDLLMEDHKRVQKLFKEFEKAARDDDDAVRELVEMACMEMQIHSLIEEEIFYPAVRGHVADAGVEHTLDVAEVEHEAADELIAKLQDLDADDPMYTAYFTVLGEYVKHHIREEEKELFPRAKQIAGLDLKQLAEDMRQRRDELFAEIESEEADEELDDADDDVSNIEDSTADDEGLEDEEEALDPRRTRH